MFLEYFGLIEHPFGVTPDPRFLHLGSKHREALASLVCGTESDRGFLALIAKPGMGKTTLLYQFLESQREKARSAFFSSPTASRANCRGTFLRIWASTPREEICRPCARCCKKSC